MSDWYKTCEGCGKDVKVNMQGQGTCPSCGREHP